MTTNRLQIYNKALTIVGARELSALTDNNKSRRALDTIWNAGAVRHCLEQGYWNFAIRTVKIDASTDIEPDFGYQYAFEQPADYVRTYAICYDEYFRSPVVQYADEAGYWFCDNDELYIQYVSDGDEYGNNMGAWPESFCRYIEYYMAAAIAPRIITRSASKVKEIEQDMKRIKIDAFSQDASNQPAQFKPRGSWARARLNGNFTNNGRGRGVF